MDWSQARKGIFETMQQALQQQAMANAKPVKMSSASKTCTPCAARARLEAAKNKFSK